MTAVVLLVFSVSLIRGREVAITPYLARKELSLDLDRMLTGPLGLYESSRPPLALALEQKLVFLAQSMRPDVGKVEKAFCIGVKGSDQTRVVKEGEAIFFEMTQHDTGAIEAIEFSNESASSCMIPHVLDGKSLLLKLGETEIFLQASSHGRAVSGMQTGVANLYKAKWWGQDLFLRQYGGKEYSSFVQKHKIELGEGKKRQVLFVGEGDFLSFTEGKWHVLPSLEEADPNAPLACVQSLSRDQLEIEAWDEKGFSLFQTKFVLEKTPPVQVSLSDLIQEPKLRSAKQISCKIGKKRMVLSPGDWLLKTQTGWRKLVEVDEIEAYLNHELSGDLMVFDWIDSKGKLKGYYFNPMRTQMEPIGIRGASSKIKRTQKRTSPTKR